MINSSGQHATDMCIFTVKSVIKYFTRQNSIHEESVHCFKQGAQEDTKLVQI